MYDLMDIFKGRIVVVLFDKIDSILNGLVKVVQALGDFCSYGCLVFRFPL
jgi:hypothetical protein